MKTFTLLKTSCYSLKWEVAKLDTVHEFSCKCGLLHYRKQILHRAGCYLFLIDGLHFCVMLRTTALYQAAGASARLRSRSCLDGKRSFLILLS